MAVQFFRHHELSGNPKEHVPLDWGDVDGTKSPGSLLRLSFRWKNMSFGSVRLFNVDDTDISMVRHKLYISSICSCERISLITVVTFMAAVGMCLL
jgi:hypothetical protein